MISCLETMSFSRIDRMLGLWLKIFAILVFISALLFLFWNNNNKYFNNDNTTSQEKRFDRIMTYLDNLSAQVEKLVQQQAVSDAKTSAPQQKESSIEHIELFEKFIADIQNVSQIQHLVPLDTLLTTLKFMIYDVDEYDPALVEFVRGLIHLPSDRSKLNLTDSTRKDLSQMGQSKKIDAMLSSQRDGFFVEAGAFDGESLSNSLFFELERNWTGLLIEPVPTLHQSIVSRRRHCYSINACIAEKKPTVAKFKVFDVYSGRENDMSQFHLARINFFDTASQRQTAFIPCFSLNTIMRALNRTRIDYFSLDVEGAEIHILKAIDYKNLDIRSFSIEWSSSNETMPLIKSLLASNNYTLESEDMLDLYYKKKL